MRWWGRICKREVCASMIPKTEANGDAAAEDWSTPVNWEEDSAIKAKQRRRRSKW